MIPVLMMVYVVFILFQGTVGPLFPRAQLKIAQSRWKQSGIISYRIKYQILKPFFPCDRLLTIKNGKVINDTMDSTCGDMLYMIGSIPSPRLDPASDLTVEGMLDQVGTILASTNPKTTVMSLVFNVQGYVESVKFNHCGYPPKGCGIGDCTDWYEVRSFERLPEQ